MSKRAFLTGLVFAALLAVSAGVSNAKNLQLQEVGEDQNQLS